LVAFGKGVLGVRKKKVSLGWTVFVSSLFSPRAAIEGAKKSEEIYTLAGCENYTA